MTDRTREALEELHRVFRKMKSAQDWSEEQAAADLKACAALAAAPQAAEPVAPSIPNDVLAYIHAYGDSRADDDGLSGLRISEAILAIRRWAHGLQQPTQQPTEQEVESLVRDIHSLLKRGERTTDHGLIGNLRCILDHLVSEGMPDVFGDQPTEQEERALFEEWALTNYYLAPPFNQKLEDGSYASALMQAAWEAWLAVRASLRGGK